MAVRVWLGAGGEPLFKLQLQSVTGSSMKSSYAEEPLFEQNVSSGASLQVRGMANYGVTSYGANLGQRVDAQAQPQLLQPSARLPSPFGSTSPRGKPRTPLFQPPFDQTAVTKATTPSSQSQRNSSRPQAQCAAGADCPTTAGVKRSAPSARNCNSTPFRKGCVVVGGGRLAAAAAQTETVSAAALCLAEDWVDALLRAADLHNGTAGRHKATGTAPASGGGLRTDQDGDDLCPDVAEDGSSRSCSTATAVTGGGKAAGCCSGVRTTGWVRRNPLSAGGAGGRDKVRPASTAAVTAGERGERDGARAGALRASECQRCRQVASATLPTCPFPATAGGGAGRRAVNAANTNVKHGDERHDGEDDVASDAGAKVFSTRWVPTNVGGHNAQLLSLLGLPDAQSFHLPFPDADPDGDCDVHVFEADFSQEMLEDCVSVLSIFDDAVSVDDPRQGAAGFGYDFLPVAPVPPAVALAATSPVMGRDGGGDGAATGATSCSLEGENAAFSASTLSASAPEPRAMLRPAAATVLLQRGLLQQRPACSPAAVEVLNLLGGEGAALVEDLGRPPPYIGESALPYMNSLLWYNDDVHGVCGGQHLACDRACPGADMLGRLYGDDDGAAGGENGGWYDWSPYEAAPGDDGNTEPSWCEIENGPLLTSMTMGAAWL